MTNPTPAPGRIEAAPDHAKASTLRAAVTSALAAPGAP